MKTILTTIALVLITLAPNVANAGIVEDIKCWWSGCSEAPSTIINQEQGDITNSTKNIQGNVTASTTIGSTSQEVNLTTSDVIVIKNLVEVTSELAKGFELLNTLGEQQLRHAGSTQELYREALANPPTLPIENSLTEPIDININPSTRLFLEEQAERQEEFLAGLFRNFSQSTPSVNVTIDTTDLLSSLPISTTTMSLIPDSSASGDVYKDFSTWSYFTALGATDLVRSNSIGVPGVALGDSSNTNSAVYELANNVPTTINQNVRIKFSKIAGNLNAMSFGVSDTGGTVSSTLFINSLTGAVDTAVVGGATAITVVSSNVTDETIELVVTVASNAAYTKWVYTPISSLNASIATTDVSLTGTQELLEINLNETIGEGSDLHRVRMVRAAAQAIPANVQTTILFDTEDYDIGSIGNTGTGVVTLAQSGTYTVNTGWTNSTSASNVQVSILVNGVSVARTVTTDTGNGTKSKAAEYTAEFTAGDTISVEAFTNVAGNTGTGIDQSYLEVNQLPAKEVVPANSVEVRTLSRIQVSLTATRNDAAGTHYEFDETVFEEGGGLTRNTTGNVGAVSGLEAGRTYKLTMNPQMAPPAAVGANDFTTLRFVDLTANATIGEFATIYPNASTGITRSNQSAQVAFFTPTVSSEVGIDYDSGTIGELSAETTFTIEEVPKGNISNVVVQGSFDDDAAAGVGGVVGGQFYQTTGAGAAPLNAAGILMVKQ